MTRQINDFPIPSFYGGLNLVDSPNSLRPDQCLELSNLQFGDGNMLEPICGFSTQGTINATAGTGVDGVLRYDETGGGEKYNLAVYNGYFYADLDDDGTYVGNEQFYGDVTGGAIFTPGLRSDWEMYKDIVYHSNGTDYQFAYRHTAWGDGNRLRRTGLPKPDASTNTATTATGAGANIPAGVYKFLWTLEMNDGVTVEGNASTNYGQCTVSETGKITITVTTPNTEELATYVNLYATETDETTYYYLTSIELSASGDHTYEWSDYGLLTTTDDSLELDTDNYRPPKGTVQCMYNNHMFIGGVSANSTYLYISKYMRFEQFPANVSGGDPVSSAYVIDCEDTIMDIRPVQNGGLLVLCQNSVQLITGYDYTSWSRNILTRASGCASAGTVATAQDGLVFWRGWDDIYATDGANLFKVGKYVWPQLKSMSASYITKSRGFFFDYKYHYAYPDDQSYNDKMYTFDTRYPTRDANGNYITFGAWLGKHSGMNIGCFTRTRREGETVAYFGDANKGVIYQYNNGNDHAGTTITSQLKTGYIHLGTPLYTKRFIAVGAEITPCAATPAGRLVFDYGRATETLTLKTSASGYEYNADDAIYNVAAYASRNYEPVKHRCSQSAQGDSAQFILTIKNESINEVAERLFAIRNLMITYSILRRFRG